MVQLRPLFRMGHRALSATRNYTRSGTAVASRTGSAVHLCVPSLHHSHVLNTSSIHLVRFFSSDSENTDKVKSDDLDSTTTTTNTEEFAGPRKRRKRPDRIFETPMDEDEATTTDSSTESSSTKGAGPSTSTSKKSITATAASGPAQTMEFQAETRQLLDIVTNSLYTEKEIFLRELVSNASDALEKLRHIQTTGREGILRTVFNPDDEDDETTDDLGLQIGIETDPENGTLTIRDTGIGLTKEEMIDNFGTIARSGSKAFINQLKQSSEEGSAFDASRGIIGKFGVGFYSAFMVGDKVEVRSRSALEKNKALKAAIWTSDGAGKFEVADLEDDSMDRGTSITIHLKEQYLEFADRDRVELVLKKYSNFVNFPIWLDNDVVNVMEAIWVKDPKEVDMETYTAFYRFIANAFDEPMQVIHFRAEAPLDVKALFYIPSFHSEKYGMERMKPGVNLYSRKILIESKSTDILPDWMRFVKGVVDSEDLPLAVSRDKPQDAALIKKLRKVLTRKFISHLTKLAQKDVNKYILEFFREHGFFLKEGICHDFEFQSDLAKLMYYETNTKTRTRMYSFDEYISRCPPEQKEIYYLYAPDRDTAVLSPYLEGFERAGIEVFFVYTAIDEFVMSNLGEYEGRKLMNCDKANIKLPEVKERRRKSDPPEVELSDSESTDFCAWFRVSLGEKVQDCSPTTRLGNSPAIVVDAESGALRRMMRLVDNTEGGKKDIPLDKQMVQVNTKHPIIVGLNAIREKEPTLALVLAEQIFDNCLLAAGLIDDGRSMLPRLNDILLTVVNDANSSIARTESEQNPHTKIVKGDVGGTGNTTEAATDPSENDNVDDDIKSEK